MVPVAIVGAGACGLVAALLLAAAQSAGTDLLAQARVTELHAAPDKRVTGVRIARPDGSCEDIGCGPLRDSFERDFTGKPALEPPWYAVKVTGALFHTQGGLVIDTAGRVLRSGGGAFPNLYAGGGAARGVSGAHVWGYLSGNGLLSAVALGRLAARRIVASLAVANPRPGDRSRGFPSPTAC